jgi:hypothetical protein
MTADEVRRILDPARHVGRSPQQVDAYLAEIAPVLARTEAGETPELRA